MKTKPVLFLLLALLLSIPGPGFGTEIPEVWTARRAVAFARQNSPDIQMAAQRVLEADAMVQKASAGLYPQIELFGRYSQTNDPMHSFGNILNQGEFSPTIDFNDPGRTDNLQLGIGLHYRLYNGSQDIAHKEAAEAGVDLSTAENEMVGLQLEFEVFRAFQRIIEGEHLIRAHEKALDAATSSLGIAQERFDAGDLLKSDLLNLEVERLNAEENLLRAQHNHTLAQKVFLVLLGLTDGDVQVEADDPESLTPPDLLEPSGRPELKRLEAALKAAEFEVTAARGSRLPTLDGFARYQHDQGTVLEGSGDSWLTGVNLSFKLFDGHQAQADIALSQARLAALRAERRKLELALGLEMAEARLAYDLALKRQRVTQKTVEQARESTRLSRARFQAGVLLVSELIDSENRLTGARVNHHLATSAVQVAIADLRRAAGLPLFRAITDQTNLVETQP